MRILHIAAALLAFYAVSAQGETPNEMNGPGNVVISGTGNVANGVYNTFNGNDNRADGSFNDFNGDTNRAKGIANEIDG
jgi:hypothetical protein